MDSYSKVKLEHALVKSEPEFVQCFCNERFYKVKVGVNRKSGFEDHIYVHISEKLVDLDKIWVGRFVDVSGDIRTYYNTRDKSVRNRLQVYVFASEITLEDESSRSKDYKNDVIIKGYICREIRMKKIRNGVSLASTMIAVNRDHGKSAYIPLILWGRNAHFVENLGVGSHVKVTGRLQSREFVLRENDSLMEINEVSADNLERAE